MEKKVLLIINPVSGTLGARSAMYDVINEFCRCGWTVTTAITQHRGHASELAEKACSQDYDLVCCCGGDGTLNETITGLMRSGTEAPVLGYVPAGSTNDFAQTLGLPGDSREAAAMITSGSPRKIDIGKFDDRFYFSYIASFGAFTQASYSAPQELKNVVGHLAYLLEGIRDISSLKPYRATVKANGKTIDGEFIFGSVSNTRSVGGIVKLKEEGIDLNDGLFEVILVKRPEGAADMSNIVSGVITSDFSSSSFEYFKASEVEFTFEKPLSWSLDGERVDGGKTVRITNVHDALKLQK